MKNRFNEDKGGAVTIFGMGLIFFTVILGVFIVDIAKNIYIKNIYYQYSQKAAEVAIKHQNKVGGLSSSSAMAAVNEYMTQRNGGGGTKEDSSFRSFCYTTGQYPKIEIKYDTDRNVGVTNDDIIFNSISGAEIDTKAYENNFNSQNYRVIQVKVTDVADNYMLGILGMPCSEITVTTSAISSSTYDQEN